MSDDPTVNITDVEPESVRVLAREVKVGDYVFDVWGGRHKVEHLHSRELYNGEIQFTREDGFKFALDRDQTITIIRSSP